MFYKMPPRLLEELKVKVLSVEEKSPATVNLCHLTRLLWLVCKSMMWPLQAVELEHILNHFVQ